MSRRLEALWLPQPGAYGSRSARGPCRYTAYVPDPLASRDLSLPAGVSADVADAEHALLALDRSPGVARLASLARFLLRAEAIGSSRIEGLVVSSRRLARHEAKAVAGITDRDATADAVLGNVAAMRLAVEDTGSRAEVTVDDLVALHERLLRDDAPHIAGRVRETQNWIGGSDANPCRAAFVPPPPEEVLPLLADLAAFVSGDATTPLVQAAVVHAQFETIHPFADGNGRTGRALIHVVLRRRGLTRSVVAPVSPVLATRSRDYLGGLTAFRYDGAADGPEAAYGLAAWVEGFVSAVRRAAADADDLSERLEALESSWRERVGPRAGSAAARLLPELAATPVVSAAVVQELTGASRSAAFAAVDQLMMAGVLRPLGTGQRDRLFEAREVFAVLTDHERASATESGDTRVERPIRPVPARLPHSGR